MKKKSHLFILFMLFVLNASGQVTPLYFNGNERVLDKEKANNYGITGKLSNQDLWMFKRYDLYDNLIQTGSYKDENLTIPHGIFIFYGSVSRFNMLNESYFDIKTGDLYKTQEGEFVDGKEEGFWKVFYPDGRIAILQEFKKGKRNGIYQEADKKGRVAIKGQFIDDKKEGNWLLKYGKIVETYKDDVLVKRGRANKKR